MLLFSLLMIRIHLFQALKLHSYSSFDELLGSWTSSEFLPKEWLPKEKILYQAMPDEYIAQLMVSIEFYLRLNIFKFYDTCSI